MNRDGQQVETGKVVSLFKPKTAEPVKSVEAQKAEPSKKEEFGSEMQRNADNAERLRRERNKANESVLKSYRIKN